MPIIVSRYRTGTGPGALSLAESVCLARYDSSPATSSGNWYKCDDPYGCFLQVNSKAMTHTDGAGSRTIALPSFTQGPKTLREKERRAVGGCAFFCEIMMEALGLLRDAHRGRSRAPQPTRQDRTGHTHLTRSGSAQGDGNPAVSIAPYKSDPSSGSFNPQAHTTWVPTSWESWPNYNAHGYGTIPAPSLSQCQMFFPFPLASCGAQEIDGYRTMHL